MADVSGLRQRQDQIVKPLWSKGGPDYDPDLPYGPKVNLARRPKPDPWWVRCLEVCIVYFLTLGFLGQQV